MKFYINDYEGKYVMHCKTVEEAKNFRDYMESTGQPTLSSLRHYYGEYVNFFNRGTWDTKEYAEEEGYTILEWSDFMNKEFTKADLKTGDVIKRRNGEIEIFNSEFRMFIKKDGWTDIRGLNDDLTSAYTDDSEWDIVAVRRPKYNYHCQFNAFKCGHGTLVYERKEVEEMTLEQVCKLLGKEIKIVK